MSDLIRVLEGRDSGADHDRTPAALAVFGPGFGLDHDFVPLEELGRWEAR